MMNATPAALSITSSESRMNNRLRRASTPAKPRANNIAARINPCSTGTPVICFLLDRPVNAAVMPARTKPASITGTFFPTIMDPGLEHAGVTTTYPKITPG